MEIEIPDTCDSDSSDTIIASDKEEPNLIPNSKTESELDQLFKKYLNEDYNAKSSSDITNVDTIFLDTSKSNSYESIINENKDISILKHRSKETDIDLENTLSNKRISIYDLEELSDLEEPNQAQAKKSKKITDSNSESEDFVMKQLDSQVLENELVVDKIQKKSSKEQQKIEKENLRKAKLAERELKKEEERRNKALKAALASHFKNLKPENCLKFIKVHIDDEIIRKEFSGDILNGLQSNNVSFTIEAQLTPSIITWTRQIESHILDTNGQLINTSKGLNIEDVLLSWNLIYNIAWKKIILAIYGLEKYYRFQKNKKRRNFAEKVSTKESKSIRDDKFDEIPTVSRRTVEYALTEIQLLYSISHRMVETKSDMALLVFQLSKSIAQVPYKLDKQEKFMQHSKWFMSEDNKNCIRVDKNGNGLSRLWKQMITTFPMASLETAEAISSIYNSPLSLIRAYENVTSISEGEKLLQDIPIRRNAGVISAARKIGPELSKKLYYLFTSIDPDRLL
ncbi:hypothetical protein HHI36_017843 [Cryptolaemus montrouzieri]|uniref:Crossover junction endonuclease EME1 n=1 Tax=Cryptolaemus montrouzieri TaxID=559131 RepID=A0ABD2NP65_9CUCU